MRACFFHHKNYIFAAGPAALSILIDKYKLPKDKYVANSEGIQCESAREISDGSFDCNDKLGTSSMIIVTNKNYIEVT